MDKKILIVDDEASLRDALSDKLMREGFGVLLAKNGADGLSLAEREHPDLILLDLIMPVMSGMTMLEKLRIDPWGKTVPVIILTNLTSYNGQHNQDKKQAEPTYFLEKTDWKIGEVVAKVREALEL